MGQLHTGVQFDEVREFKAKTVEELERRVVQQLNDMAHKMNDLVNSIKRSGIEPGTTVILAGGGVLFTGGGSSGTGGDAAQRAGKTLIGTTDTIVAFSSPIVGPFVLSPARCYDQTDITVPVQPQIISVTTGGFTARAAVPAILEWSTQGVV